jgi:hypothetical protein
MHRVSGFPGRMPYCIYQTQRKRGNDMPTDTQLQAAFLAARQRGKILDDETLSAILATASPPNEILPGARLELNAISGNPGRKGFVLYVSNTEPDKALIRFDGFAYNSLVPIDRFDILPDEPFRF